MESLLNKIVYTVTTLKATRRESVVFVNPTSLVQMGFASSLRPQVPLSPPPCLFYS